MLSAKGLLSPATDRVVVEAKIWWFTVSGPAGPGVASGRWAKPVIKTGPDRAANCEASWITMTRDGPIGDIWDPFPSVVASALGTTMTWARAAGAAHAPRRAARSPAKPTLRLANMVESPFTRQPQGAQTERRGAAGPVRSFQLRGISRQDAKAQNYSWRLGGFA
jgi:hypothetical protein